MAFYFRNGWLFSPEYASPPRDTGTDARHDDGPGDLFWTEALSRSGVWEFAVLAASLDVEMRSLAQLYRAGPTRRMASTS